MRGAIGTARGIMPRYRRQGLSPLLSWLHRLGRLESVQLERRLRILACRASIFSAWSSTISLKNRVDFGGMITLLPVSPVASRIPLLLRCRCRTG